LGKLLRTHPRPNRLTGADFPIALTGAIAMRPAAICFPLVVLAAAAVLAAEHDPPELLFGKVISIADGDTLTVLVPLASSP
jgi:hypothetical protein